jgi:hypothetical protein
MARNDMPLLKNLKTAYLLCKWLYTFLFMAGASKIMRDNQTVCDS